MALRFSGSAPSDSAVTATDLPPRAQQLLAADDLDGYRALFAQLEPIEDPQRRHWAAVGLVERGLAAGAGASSRRLPELFATVAAGAIDALEREPSEPRLLNYTGVLLYELWSLDAARATFKAAKRLDPSLPEIDRNLAALAKRRKAIRDAAHRAPLHPTLPGLARRALEIAARAQPAKDLRLSLCMIVRDEEQMLPRCLAAVADAVDEIVIVDTGSIDRTVEIAHSFGAQVISHAWTGSFAEARNVSFDAASGDWLMYLDADEVLVREDAQLLRSLTGHTWREAFYLSETNYTGDLEDGTAVTHNALRIFRNRPQYRFEGRLHEQIANRLPGYLPERFEATNVRIEHYGYLGVVRDGREKSRRNIELLRLQQAESPPTPFLHYNLGSEYAAAGDPSAALAEFERSWALIEASADGERYEFAPALISRLVKALRVCGRPQDALTRSQDGLERFPGFTDLVLEQAILTATLGHTDRAIELYERCIEMGDAPRRYTATVGCGTYLPRIHLAEFRRARGELEPAIDLLEHCVREHPQFTGSVLPYASALLANGTDPATVVAELERRMPDPSPAVRFMLGTALYEAGATVSGEEQFRAVLARQPHSSRARIALGETLLAQRRYSEAASETGAIPVDDPLVVMACRTELFARIAAGKEDASVFSAIERARSAGMPAAELDLLIAWDQLARSGATAISPAPAAVPLLAVMLEALLRVQDFEVFETLHGLWQRTPLSPQERRHTLAEMYLRRGFLASAAEEWMAVAQEDPSDAQALLGLARVAATRGMAREAADFAGAALAQDPQSQAAANLLAEVRTEAA
ncbi:MAG TPA: glycosyltransferase [Solirubrobacteraceae bacterium]|jgi:tetratricopeptide (TPR) repeat protein|nr:glycosyltransferase [Solirubrobacteraceae bacterium]